MGNPDAAGIIYVGAPADGKSEFSGFLGSGFDWGVTIRSGTCADPGDVLYTIGPIENGQLATVINVHVEDVRGKILVLTRLGADIPEACGPIPPE